MLEVRSRAIFRNVSHVAGGSVMDDAVRRSRGSLCVPLCILATSVRPMKKAPIARARNEGPIRVPRPLALASVYCRTGEYMAAVRGSSPRGPAPLTAPP